MQPLGFNFSLLYLMAALLCFRFQHHSARNHMVKSQLDGSTCLAEPQLLPTNQILFALFIFRVTFGTRLYTYARMRYTSWLMLPSDAAIGTEAGSSGSWRALNPPCTQVSPSFRLVTFSARLLCLAKYLLPGAIQKEILPFYFFIFSFPPLIPFLPFPSCLAGGRRSLFQPDIKLKGEGWLAATSPAVALFWLVNGVRGGIRTEC